MRRMTGMARLSRSTKMTTAVTLVAVALVTACERRQADPRVTTVGVEGHVNDHVSAASDGDSFVALAWSASPTSGTTGIFAAVSSDAGQSFSAPVRVSAAGSPVNVNGEQPPRIVVSRGQDGAARLIVLWTGRGSEGTSLLYARSEDGGRSFGPTLSLDGVSAPGNRGWQSMALDASGRPIVLWLDHRDIAATSANQAGPHHHHGSGTSAGKDGFERAQRSQLFVSAVEGDLAPKSIARGVCYCCKTALATGTDGFVYAAWRHVYEGNMRDIAFASSRDGGRSFDAPARVSEDQWQLDGCPENGPAIAVSGQRVHVVWPTLVRKNTGETLELFYASTTDGRTFTRREPIPAAGAAYHPQVTVGPQDSLVVAWDELESSKRRVKAARVTRDDNGGLKVVPVALSGEAPGSYPALASTRTHAVLAWARDADGKRDIAVTRIAY